MQLTRHGYEEDTWTEKPNLSIAAQNNTIRTNYVKKIDYTLKNCRCWWCGDRDETIIHILSKYSKVIQKDKKVGMTGCEKKTTGNYASE